MTSHTHDDGFHEIQLNGKQLVFLFIAATVASVVIFLCGVLVGRGVRIERAAIAQAEEMSQTPMADVPSLTAGTPAAPADSSVVAVEAVPTPIEDDLSYGKRLEDSNQPADELKPAAPRPALVAHATSASPAESSRPAQKPALAEKTSAAGSIPPPDSGFVVQVAALNERGEADAIAKKLTSKGYPAYVQAPTGGTLFRVRVGGFKSRREAETVAAKLQKEERITPWVTR